MTEWLKVREPSAASNRKRRPFLRDRNAGLPIAIQRDIPSAVSCPQRAITVHNGTLFFRVSYVKRILRYVIFLRPSIARVSTTDQDHRHQDRVKPPRSGGSSMTRFWLTRASFAWLFSTIILGRRAPRSAAGCFDQLRAIRCWWFRWVDRLGRHYTDVVDTVREFMPEAVIVSGHQLDGVQMDRPTDPHADSFCCAVCADCIMAATAQSPSRGHSQRNVLASTTKRLPEHVSYRGRKPSYTREQLIVSSCAVHHRLILLAVPNRQSRASDKQQTIFRVRQPCRCQDCAGGVGEC